MSLIDSRTRTFCLHETWTAVDVEDRHAGNPHWAPFVDHTDDGNLDQKAIVVVAELVFAMGEDEFLLSVLAVAAEQIYQAFEVDEVLVAVWQNDEEVIRLAVERIVEQAFDSFVDSGVPLAAVVSAQGVRPQAETEDQLDEESQKILEASFGSGVAFSLEVELEEQLFALVLVQVMGVYSEYWTAEMAAMIAEVAELLKDGYLESKGQ